MTCGEALVWLTCFNTKVLAAMPCFKILVVTRKRLGLHVIYYATGHWLLRHFAV
jgi:hypothetical protein